MAVLSLTFIMPLSKFEIREMLLQFCEDIGRDKYEKFSSWTVLDLLTRMFGALKVISSSSSQTLQVLPRGKDIPRKKRREGGSSLENGFAKPTGLELRKETKMYVNKKGQRFFKRIVKVSSPTLQAAATVSSSTLSSRAKVFEPSTPTVVGAMLEQAVAEVIRRSENKGRSPSSPSKSLVPDIPTSVHESHLETSSKKSSSDLSTVSSAADIQSPVVRQR